MNDAYEDRQRSKERRNAARVAAAKRLAGLSHTLVDSHANVLPMAAGRGAYVEASIYVSEEEIQEALADDRLARELAATAMKAVEQQGAQK